MALCEDPSNVRLREKLDLRLQDKYGFLVGAKLRVEARASARSFSGFNNFQLPRIFKVVPVNYILIKFSR